MYRHADSRSTTPPVVLRYRTQLVRYRVFAIAAVLVVVGFVSLLPLHYTRFRCVKDAQGVGFCELAPRSLLGGADPQTIPLDEIDKIDFVIRYGSKGHRYAEVLLHVRGGGNTPPRTIDLGGGRGTSGFDISEAESTIRRFEALRRAPGPQSFDLWLGSGALQTGLMLLLALGFPVLAFVMVRETLAQRRWIEIAVDHDRRVVAIGGQEVSFDEIDDVGIDNGRALYWASGKNEHIPGYRIFVELVDRSRIFATRDYRAGELGEHERARFAQLRELGMHEEARDAMGRRVARPR